MSASCSMAPDSRKSESMGRLSERLSGPPTAEKDAFLDAENERFAALHAQLEQAAAQADTYLMGCTNIL